MHKLLSSFMVISDVHRAFFEIKLHLLCTVLLGEFQSSKALKYTE